MHASALTSHRHGGPAGNRFASLYTDVGVQCAAASDSSSHALIGMLYEGALGAIARARGAMQSRDVAAKSRAIDKALAIVGEGLRASLNLELGGAIARDLDALYGYIGLRLTHAHVHNDEPALAECARLLKPLHEAWTQIGTQVHPAA